MPKYGRGLNREIAIAVRERRITEPFSAADVRRYVQSRGWVVPDTYITVCLANGASEMHSNTYKKYFKPIGEGMYKLSDIGVKA
jgi:hypothetical protein